MEFGLMGLIYQWDYVADTEKVIWLNTKNKMDSKSDIG